MQVDLPNDYIPISTSYQSNRNLVASRCVENNIFVIVTTIFAFRISPIDLFQMRRFLSLSVESCKHNGGFNAGLAWPEFTFHKLELPVAPFTAAF